MEEARLLSLPKGIQVHQIQITEQGLLIEAQATASTASCLRFTRFSGTPKHPGQHITFS